MGQIGSDLVFGFNACPAQRLDHIMVNGLVSSRVAHNLQKDFLGEQPVGRPSGCRKLFVLDTAGKTFRAVAAGDHATGAVVDLDAGATQVRVSIELTGTGFELEL